MHDAPMLELLFHQSRIRPQIIGEITVTGTTLRVFDIVADVEPGGEQGVAVPDAKPGKWLVATFMVDIPDRDDDEAVLALMVYHSDLKDARIETTKVGEVRVTGETATILDDSAGPIYFPPLSETRHAVVGISGAVAACSPGEYQVNIGTDDANRVIAVVVRFAVSVTRRTHTTH